jgi:hypothetical protein
MTTSKPGAFICFPDVFLLFVSSDEAGSAGRPTADQVRVDPIKKWYKLECVDRLLTR